MTNPDTKAELLDTVWIMHTANNFYPIQPSNKCKPEDHAEANPHIVRIEDANGNTIWRKGAIQ